MYYASLLCIHERATLKVFYSDHFVLPLPEGHRFPMIKYSMLRESVSRRPTSADPRR